ncbi:aminotransferase class III-fold pyridoxal phosphate-dependent enzyme, partial [Nitrospirota bacterium]
MENRYDELSKADHEFIWHPFTQMKGWNEEEPIIITEGRDCFLKDIKGKWYLDGVSSIWVNTHGHRKKELDEAVKAQLGKIAHTTMLGLASEPSILLAKRLAGILKESFGDGAPQKVFYSDNGSTSVEVALKMAYQYWVHKGVPGRHTFMTLSQAYHGDTLGAVSVGGVDIFHENFRKLLFDTYKAPSPSCYRCELGLELP